MKFRMFVLVVVMCVASAQTLFADNFVYNRNRVGNTETIEVYKRQGNALSRYQICIKTYDELNRLALKEVCSWNELTGKLKKQHRLIYSYNAEGYTVEFAKWNPISRLFDTDGQKFVYRMDDLQDGVVKMAIFEKDKTNSTYKLVRVSEMQDSNAMLIAGVGQ